MLQQVAPRSLCSWLRCQPLGRSFRCLQQSVDARRLSSSVEGQVERSLARVRAILDSHVVGQASVKEAILLGLVSREHVYIEGPPGVAKTYVAELISECTTLSFWFYQLHRDTRLNDIIGEAVITKEVTPTGDVIRQDVLRGGILTCELAVLDDISRAPGEALNVLLRILNERKFGSGPANNLPLLSAVATGNPAQDDAYYAEPLDPATLDRFTLQVRVKGLINEGNWKAASDVIDMYDGPRAGDLLDDGSRELEVLKSGEFLYEVALGRPTKTVLIELLRVLHEDHGLGEGNSLLTDRTFLVKAVKILKANAVLNGRKRCEPQDLYAMRYLTTFRVPTKVHDQITQIIAEILAKRASPPGEDTPDDDGVLPDTKESIPEEKD